MNKPDPRIAAAFSRAATHYESSADVQRKVAATLASRIVELGTTSPVHSLPGQPRILEIGAGTGFLSRLLLDRIPGGEWLITDLSASMLRQCQRQIDDPRARMMVADGENPPAGFYDLIASSLALQWFSHLETGLRNLAQCLSPCGMLAFAMLGVDTFKEWRDAHQNLGLPCGIRMFPSAEELGRLWPSGGIGTVEEQHLVTSHVDGRDFVRGLKTLGANTPRQGYRPLPPHAFKQLLRQMGGNFQVTYHVLYGYFQRV